MQPMMFWTNSFCGQRQEMSADDLQPVSGSQVLRQEGRTAGQGAVWTGEMGWMLDEV